MYFSTNQTTGVKNEAAISRAQKLFAAADKLGIGLRCDDVHYANGINGREAIEAAILAL